MSQKFINSETLEYNLELEGKLNAVSPSNIALVKYWGKFGEQLPCNPSLSITLTNAHTKTELYFSPKKEKKSSIDLDFYFDGTKNEKFADKIHAFLTSITKYCSFLVHYKLVISSNNTFPHSSGIASSASSMSSISLLIIALEKMLTPKEHLYSDDYYINKASFLARLGSGSACRSLFNYMSVWGESEYVLNSTNDFGISFNDFHEKFNNINDSIAIVSAGEKSVSSRAGHALMKTHPFAQVRFQNARTNLSKLLKALKDGDFNLFCEVVECEALELHGLMMNSTPSFILMAPNTLEIISRIRSFRAKTSLPICFTLDAGPNVHILYLASAKEAVLKFLDTEVSPLCEGRPILHDQMGLGASLVHA